MRLAFFQYRFIDRKKKRKSKLGLLNIEILIGFDYFGLED